jgi:hypothetical protein
MPRFFFDLVDYKAVAPDPNGTTWPDVEAARVRAVADAREIVSKGARQGEDRRGRTFEINDESQAILVRVPFTDAGSPA